MGREETLEQRVNRIVEQLMAKRVEQSVDGMKRDTEAAERRIAELEFERLVGQNAVLGGVLPKAVKYIAASAAELFEIRENELVVRNGETDPSDPCISLSFAAWLKELCKDHDFLFAPVQEK